MKLLLVALILLTLVGIIFLLPEVLAARSQPESTEFNFGVRLDLAGEQVFPSINAAAGLNMDWIALDLDWAEWMPNAEQMPELNTLNAVMQAARESNLRVMISLVHAPAWAVTPHGPDASLTAQLALSLASLYGDTLHAIELYPEANTLAGWGAPPDPAACAALLQEVDAALKAKGFSIILVTSLAPPRESGDIDDRLFLETMYRYGAADWMPVVGVRLPSLTGDPKADPHDNARNVLRRYETLRKVMLQNDHATGLIWITGFSWPVESDYAPSYRQAEWIDLAYRLLRTQLYIGAAFFQQLNPPTNRTDPATGLYISLILPDGSLHPACERLSKLTSLDGNVQKVYFQGPVTKKMPLKATIKP